MLHCNLVLRVYILLRLKFWRVLPEVIVNNAIRIVDNGTDSPNNATRIAIDPTKIPVVCVLIFCYNLSEDQRGSLPDFVETVDVNQSLERFLFALSHSD